MRTAEDKRGTRQANVWKGRSGKKNKGGVRTTEDKREEKRGKFEEGRIREEAKHRK